jgi:hypothetical protein
MTTYPLPWRGICRHCTTTLSTTTGQPNTWRNPHGDTECTKAPTQPNSDPGHHHPRKALSANGDVPPTLWLEHPDD